MKIRVEWVQQKLNTTQDSSNFKVVVPEVFKEERQLHSLSIDIPFYF